MGNKLTQEEAKLEQGRQAMMLWQNPKREVVRAGTVGVVHTVAVLPEICRGPMAVWSDGPMSDLEYAVSASIYAPDFWPKFSMGIDGFSVMAAGPVLADVEYGMSVTVTVTVPVRPGHPAGLIYDRITGWRPLRHSISYGLVIIGKE